MADDKVNGEMTGYLTRGELREELDIRDKRFEAIDKRFEAIDKRFEAIDKRFEAVDKRFDALDRRFDDFEQRMIHSLGQMAVAIGDEIGRQIRASEERTRDFIRGLQDPYRDLPERVERLEEHTGLKR